MPRRPSLAVSTSTANLLSLSTIITWSPRSVAHRHPSTASKRKLLFWPLNDAFRITRRFTLYWQPPGAAATSGTVPLSASSSTLRHKSAIGTARLPAGNAAAAHQCLCFGRSSFISRLLRKSYSSSNINLRRLLLDTLHCPSPSFKVLGQPISDRRMTDVGMAEIFASWLEHGGTLQLSCRRLCARVDDMFRVRLDVIPGSARRWRRNSIPYQPPLFAALHRETGWHHPPDFQRRPFMRRLVTSLSVRGASADALILKIIRNAPAAILDPSQSGGGFFCPDTQPRSNKPANASRDRLREAVHCAIHSHDPSASTSTPMSLGDDLKYLTWARPGLEFFFHS
ncbi:hypothetical protein C8035_v001057 [Colletotrichum spinosum]|uniref:Uncharacterized protein n=1 Tax=Colletotrichum spinosum TaxID=1347390 RepID=A0A4V3HRJ2_9PEZI|nr:hypothetical protein C8035_v001057 [Colletotrichum spinosum]